MYAFIYFKCKTTTFLPDITMYFNYLKIFQYKKNILTQNCLLITLNYTHILSSKK